MRLTGANTRVYTWRVSSAMKASLEEAARNTNRSVAKLLDEIVAERLDAAGRTSEAEMDKQRRLHVRCATAQRQFPADALPRDCLRTIRCYFFSPLNSTMSLVTLARAIARRLPSRDQAKSMTLRSSVKCVS